MKRLIWALILVLPACTAVENIPNSAEDEDPTTLDAKATVIRDVDGIPHIYATTNEDAYYLQGWATARDRLFQMEITRRRALGTRAEILGEDYFASDLQGRALQWREWGQRTADAIKENDPEIHGYVEAYVAGVNRWIEETKAGTGGAKLSPQFAALGFEPEPWTVADSMAVEKMLATGLSMRPDQDIILGLVDLLLDEDLFADFYRYQGFDTTYVVPDFYGARSQELVPEDDKRSVLRDSNAAAMRERMRQIPLQQLAMAARRAQDFSLSHGGSNNWVVAGEHTESGYPIIAGDSHQGVEHPAVYYFVHINSKDAGGDVDIIGASFPGVPFVVFGHNGQSAFTPTTSIFDVADVYQEKFNSIAKTVEFNGEDVAVDVRDEVIRVRNPGESVDTAEERVEQLYVVPHHGPMIPSKALGLPIPLQLSVRWVGYQETSLGRAFHEMGVSQSFEDFRSALGKNTSAAMHWMYADVDGTIGYSSRVDVPIREVVDADTPPIKILPGEGGFEWVNDGENGRPFAHVPDDDVPYGVNPDSGYFASANNDPVGQTDDNDPFNDAVYLSGIFDIGTRAYQPNLLLQRLKDEGPMSLQSVANVQLDTKSRLSERITPFIINASKLRPDLVTGDVQTAINILVDWDHTCGLDSAAASIFHGWLAVFTKNMLQDTANGILNSVALEDLDPKIGLVLSKTVVYWLEATANDIEAIEDGTMPFPSQSGENFFDDLSTPELETRDELILDSLAQALTQMQPIFETRLGSATAASDLNNWRWGAWHTMQLVDYADGVLPEASSEALPKTGCLYTVDVADYQWLSGGVLPEELATTNGPSNRFVFEMNPDGVQGLAILPGGQSEHPDSPHHNDQFQDFLDGKWRPLRYLRSDVEADASETVELD